MPSPGRRAEKPRVTCLLVWIGVTLACASACGRIGFDALDSSDAGKLPADARPAVAFDGQFLPSYDYCQEMPALPGAPIIDGVLDGSLPLQELVGQGWTGSEMQPAGHGARLAVAHRPDGVYIFADVDNPVRVPSALDEEEYCGDGIEIYLDGDGLFSPSPDLPNYGDDAIQLIYAAPTDDTQPALRSARWRNYVKLGAPRAASVVQPRPGGYVFEAFIENTDLEPGGLASEVGGYLGFNLSLNVSYDDGTLSQEACPKRAGQVFLHIATDLVGDARLPFANNQAFCRPLLL